MVVKILWNLEACLILLLNIKMDTKEKSQLNSPNTKRNEDENAMKYLDIIEKTATQLKSENFEFIRMMQKLFVLFKEKNKELKKKKIDLIELFISNIQESNLQEFASLNDTIKQVFKPEALTVPEDLLKPLHTEASTTKEENRVLKKFKSEAFTVPQDLLNPLYTEANATKEENRVLKKFKSEAFTVPQDLLNPLYTEANATKEENRVLKEFKPEDPLKPFYIEASAIKEKNIVLIHGKFCNTFIGKLRKSDGSIKSVAIKVPKFNYYKEKIYNEARALSQFDHKNIVRLYGINNNALEMVFELMDLGDLYTALEKLNFTNRNLFNILENIADAMKYLEEKKFLHRNLALKNVFMNSKKQCKIGGFELSVFVGNSNGVFIQKDCPNVNVPSPEVYSAGKFTVKSDVWAMGILCWELFVMPVIIDLSLLEVKEVPLKDAAEFFWNSFENTQMKLEKTPRCPEQFHVFIVTGLLERIPERRPNFTIIREEIRKFLHN